MAVAGSDKDARSTVPAVQAPGPWRRSVIGLIELLLAALRRDSPALDVASLAQAIAFARITLIVGLVILHYGQFPNSATSPYRGMDPVLYPLATYVNSLVLFFLFSVVPLLSTISGYLFFSFGDDPRRQLVDRIKRRFSSLYLPLLIWNSLYVGILLLVWIATPGYSLLAALNIDFEIARTLDYVNAIAGLTEHPVGFQFWFVRDLFLTVLCSPVLWLLIRRAPLLGALGLGAVWLTGSTLGIFFRTDVLFFFYVGGLLRVSGTRLEIGAPATLVLSALYLIMVALRAAVPAFYDDAPTGMAHNFLMASTRVMRVIGVLACWGVILRIAPTSFGRVVGSLGGLAFFLHAVHYPLLAQIKLLLWPLVPAEQDGWMLAHYASSTLLTLALGIGTGILLARQAPTLFALMNGGRSLRWAAPS